MWPMLPAIFAQTSSPLPEDFGILKWVAVAIMGMTFVNSFLWFIYLRKENRNRAHDQATLHDLKEMEADIAERFVASDARMLRMEDILESRTKSIYEKIAADASLIGRAVATMARDLAHVEGSLSVSGRRKS